MRTLSLEELVDLARDPLDRETLAGVSGGNWAVVTDLRDGDSHARHDPGGVTDMPDDLLGDLLGHLVCVLVAIGAEGHPLAGAFDVVVSDPTAAAEITAAVEAHPIAATSLALLLRGGPRRTIGDGLVAESATYSTLQAGPEHRTWLSGRTRRQRPLSTEPPVRVVRTDGVLRLTLARPVVRNAYNSATRDALLEGLALAALDPSITEVVVAGDGPAFCSGGDLDEFGTLPDPATAHLVRLTRSAARAVHDLADRVTFRLHGACIGAGIELPAFSHRIVATRDATFTLPEVAMGLVPGAGGTVSIPRRIGRQRTAWLALTGRTIDSATALDWRLIDEITDEP